MQDPFQSFLGADPVPADMTPDAKGDPAAAVHASSPQDAQPVVQQQPLVEEVPAGSTAVVEATASPMNMKMLLGFGAIAVLGYWLIKGKAAKTNPSRRRH